MTALERWLIIFILFVLVVAFNSISGCAQVPPCEKFAYSVHVQDGVPYYVLDQDNAVKLVQMVESLNNGTCRIE